MTVMTATRQVLREAVASRVTPGAAVAIVRASGEILRLAEGHLTYEADAAAVDDETIYDLASLTKVLVTTTLLADLVTRHRLDLDAAVHDILPIWRRGPLSRVTLRHLLTHSAGVPAHLPLYRTCTDRAAYLDALDRVKPIAEVASVSVYSDLGFIALGLVLEMVTGRPLGEAYAAWLHAADFGHLALTYFPVDRDRRRVAPTEWDPWRQRLLLAEVHDENAWALGGDAGHAGLFGTAAAVGRVANWWMRRVREQDEWRLWTSPCLVPDSSRALGWDTMRPTSSCGPLFSATSFGHTGFTGTSLWIDPVRQTGVVLLSNRVHPSRAGDRMQPFRRRLHTAVAHDFRWS
jgi:CubicO group peptidase (beta-lactamase class C family)